MSDETQQGEELSNISDQLNRVLKEIKKNSDKVEEVASQIQEVKTHPSQNGGWASLMQLIQQTGEALQRIDDRLDTLEKTLNNPEQGTIARLKELTEWRRRADDVLEGNRKQDERLMRLEFQISQCETQMQNYNKLTWVVAVGVIGLVIKALASLIIQTPT